MLHFLVKKVSFRAYVSYRIIQDQLRDYICGLCHQPLKKLRISFDELLASKFKQAKFACETAFFKTTRIMFG